MTLAVAIEPSDKPTLLALVFQLLLRKIPDLRFASRPVRLVWYIPHQRFADVGDAVYVARFAVQLHAARQVVGPNTVLGKEACRFGLQEPP